MKTGGKRNNDGKMGVCGGCEYDGGNGRDKGRKKRKEWSIYAGGVRTRRGSAREQAQQQGERGNGGQGVRWRREERSGPPLREEAEWRLW